MKREHIQAGGKKSLSSSPLIQVVLAIPVLLIAAYLVYFYRPDEYVWRILDVAHKYIEGYVAMYLKTTSLSASANSLDILLCADFVMWLLIAV